jgi:predicted phosphodiesterase
MEGFVRLAVLSDIHGNILALDSVMADLSEAGSADVIWVLGDLALFGPSPEAVIHQVRNLPNIHVIQGNTDRYMTDGVRPAMPAPQNSEDWAKTPAALAARDSTFRWTYERLGYENYTYLRELPTELSLEVESYGMVAAFHAAPGDDEFGFMPDTSDDVISEKLAGVAARLTLVGHTHLPMDRQIGECRVLNPGSVGLPFDGDPRAAYAILDFDKDGNLALDMRRVAYDVEKAVDFLHALEHPTAVSQGARLRHALMNPPMPAD